MICLQVWINQHLGQDLLESQTEFDLDLTITLTVKVKLFQTAKIVITLLVVVRFD